MQLTVSDAILLSSVLASPQYRVHVAPFEDSPDHGEAVSCSCSNNTFVVQYCLPVFLTQAGESISVNDAHRILFEGIFCCPADKLERPIFYAF